MAQVHIYASHVTHHVTLLTITSLQQLGLIDAFASSANYTS